MSECWHVRPSLWPENIYIYIYILVSGDVEWSDYGPARRAECTVCVLAASPAESGSHLTCLTG